MLTVAEPEREPDEHADDESEPVTVSDEDEHIDARAEPVVHTLAERENVPVTLADTKLDAEREYVPDALTDAHPVDEMERVGEPVKEGLTEPERETRSDGGREGDCDGVPPACVVVREPVNAVDDDEDTVRQPDTDADRESDFRPLSDGVPDGDPLVDCEKVLVRESVRVMTSVGGRV